MKQITLAFLAIAAFSNAQVDLINEDFQAGIPVDYTLVDNDGLTPAVSVSEYSEAWISAEDPDDQTNLVAGSTSFFDPIGKANRWMITPQVTLGTIGNFITWNAMSHDPSYVEDYMVLVSTTDNQLSSFTDTLIYVDDENPSWTTHSFDLTEEGYANQSVYFAFVLRTYDGFKLYIDSLHVWKDDPAGIEITEKVNVTISPNPSSDHVSVSGDVKINSLKIVSLSGEELIRSASNTVSVAALAKGIYVAIIETDSGIVQRRIVKN